MKFYLKSVQPYVLVKPHGHDFEGIGICSNQLDTGVSRKAIAIVLCKLSVTYRPDEHPKVFKTDFHVPVLRVLLLLKLYQRDCALR